MPDCLVLRPIRSPGRTRTLSPIAEGRRLSVDFRHNGGRHRGSIRFLCYPCRTRTMALTLRFDPHRPEILILLRNLPRPAYLDC